MPSVPATPPELTDRDTDRHDPGRTFVRPAFRPATIADVDALTELERIANEASIGISSGIPYPTDAVAARWRAEVSEPSKTVEVVETDAGLVCFVCFDAYRLQHLAVHPDHWGRGLARAAVERAMARMTGDPVRGDCGTTPARGGSTSISAGR